MKNVNRTNKEIRIRGKNRTAYATDRLLYALSTFKEQCDAEEISISRRCVHQVFEQRFHRAAVRSRGIHNLRHTCGTRLYEETRDLQVVAKHLGHSTT